MAVVLIYRALGLGDFLTGVPAYRALRRAFPDHRIVLAAPQALAPLAELTGAIDEVVDTAPLGPAPPGADIAVNLHGRGPQSTALLRASHPNRLIAFGDSWRADEHEVQRWCRLLREHGIEADPGDLRLDPPAVPSPAPGATVVHPGAASEARRWPADRWTEVARRLDDVVITGGPEERALAERVARGVPGARVLAGETNLLTLAATVAHASLVLCGDTGVAHLATAFGTPSVVLFGPTPPDEWGPPADRPQHRVLWSGRTGDPHAATPDPGLLEISVDDVLGYVPASQSSSA
ncbi:glycosyltransferase family 9 protein [Solirubrobacter sp. CPCC 204708]|uniref:Glycosyltransferase family 9 protein n=1 Tax=Solirubrobacter deserti TaxID=2282478 RepID=A0ABT4RR06_9ACTN|nr:glycosyltransferase family 9 protein [Solirubrobacter deserti]MBE2320056.1 glycosyltransferase family 9 protein [Solirubrobacter deserti]MDA0141004.1 glycosyltransferase family 9 protein [Solirubrobacter deserti]